MGARLFEYALVSNRNWRWLHKKNEVAYIGGGTFMINFRSAL